MQKEVDYIIVGFGLAGMAMANILEEHQKSFVVFEDTSQTSSHVAGGVYNPIVLKRFTPVWQGDLQLSLAMPFYEKLEAKFQKKYDYKFVTKRVFKSIEEQNNWFAASDKPFLEEYLDTKLDRNSYEGVVSDFGFGNVLHTGRIDTHTLLTDYQNYLKTQGSFIEESFVHVDLVLEENSVVYQNLKAKKIVFCEGYGLIQNPFFNYLPMNEAKGELLTIHAPNLNVDFLIKAAVFVLPLGNDLFKVGATFDWKDKTTTISKEGREELVTKLDTFINVPYKILDQSAGIRPTVKDRRPLVGIHPKYPQLAILNGLGTRGVMIAPKVSKELFDHLENENPLDIESDIIRFVK